MPETYYGKLCEKHPTASGLREARSRLCIECWREKRRKYKNVSREKTMKEARLERIRYGFEAGDAEAVIRNVAIECAAACFKPAQKWPSYVHVASRIMDSYRKQFSPVPPPLDPEVVARVLSRFPVEAAQNVPRETEEPDA